MYSGEGEYVAFASDCICDGPVEHWLQVRKHIRTCSVTLQLNLHQDACLGSGRLRAQAEIPPLTPCLVA